MEILKGFFDNLQSKPKYLNYSKSKSIQVCLDTARLPSMIPVYKLNDNDHHCQLTFSEATMGLITANSSEISSSLRREVEKEFFLNDELKVFSERMHNKCAVSFLSMEGVRINMMVDTFSKMVHLPIEMSTMLSRLREKVKDTSKNLKQLLDVVLAKCNECNVDNQEFQTFLQQLHQCANSLGQQGANLPNDGNPVLNITISSNENDDDDEDGDGEEEEDDYDDYYHHRRGRHWGYNDYDEDEDEDEDMEDEYY